MKDIRYEKWAIGVIGLFIECNICVQDPADVVRLLRVVIEQ